MDREREGEREKRKSDRKKVWIEREGEKEKRKSDRKKVWIEERKRK